MAIGQKPAKTLKTVHLSVQFDVDDEAVLTHGDYGDRIIEFAEIIGGTNAAASVKIIDE